MDDPTNDQLLASAVRFLIDGRDEQSTRLLILCSLDVTNHGDWDGEQHFTVALFAPRAAYDALQREDDPVGAPIRRAIEAVLPAPRYPVFVRNYIVRAELVPITPGWRNELIAEIRGRNVNNQGSQGLDQTVYTWEHLRFRSKAEMRVAQALDKAGVLFLPNCAGRLTADGRRQKREPDFLVCLDGKWGILEVDGEVFHPASRAAEDHARDYAFKEHGVQHIIHFDATQCYYEPDRVVERFLRVLKK